MLNVKQEAAAEISNNTNSDCVLCVFVNRINSLCPYTYNTIGVECVLCLVSLLPVAAAVVSFNRECLYPR